LTPFGCKACISIKPFTALSRASWFGLEKVEMIMEGLQVKTIDQILDFVAEHQVTLHSTLARPAASPKALLEGQGRRLKPLISPPRLVRVMKRKF
jgi:hypothetical protein